MIDPAGERRRRRARGKRRLCVVAAIGLVGCAHAPAPAPAQSLNLPVQVQDVAGFALPRPKVVLRGETIHLSGRLCRRAGWDTYAPRRLLIAGYDADHRRLFRREVRVAPLLTRSDDVCHPYSADLPARPAPLELLVSAIPYGADAPPE